MQKSFIMIKPDAVRRKLIGKIIDRIEQSGLKIVAMKTIKPKKEFVQEFYPSNDEWFETIGERAKKDFLKQGLNIKDYYPSDVSIEMGKTVKEWLIKYITSGQVVGMVVEGENAITVVRELCGHTFPERASKGTIRGDFADDNLQTANKEGRAIYNIIHASGNEAEAANEINLWFKKEEIVNYSE